ncbi:DNA-directed RNA polymerase II subunit RPB1-like [Trachinotus anak]|uniref:DNA-directed RNA polymerase II subunit RPB1-like n=1 Tax=Trachinotus anak TaxID=443729 RepID=UPI0039F1986F
MVLGCLFCVSWFCLLLFDGSVGLPAIKGYGYPYTADSRNIGDDGEDDVLTSPTFESNWLTSNGQLTDHTSYNKPSVAQQPVSVPAQQKLPNTPSAPQVERLVNGASRDWGLENLDKPLTFPLRPNYQPSAPEKLQPGPIQPQSTSYYYPAPFYTPQAAKSSSFDSWQPESVSSDHGVPNFNTGSSAHGGDSSNMPHLVFEEVFQYPSENSEPSAPSHSGISSPGGYNHGHYVSESLTENALEPLFPSYTANVGTQPVVAPGWGSSSRSYQPHNERTSPQLSQKVASYQNVVSQRVSEPILPPPPPTSYIIQSRNGYQRGRYLLTDSSYSPEFPPPMPLSSPSVKGPAISYPASPKGVKNPQRTKW